MANHKNKAKDIVFRIRKFNPETDPEPRWEDFKLSVMPGMTVLDGLHEIKAKQDKTLAMRYSCRMGVCGSCAMLINGKPALACNTQIKDVAESVLLVAPLPNFEIIKDLVPDLMPMFEKHTDVSPFIIRDDMEEVNHPSGEFFQSPEELVQYLQFAYCIKCGACMAACPTVATDREYCGPMPLTAAHRFNSDTRDDGFEVRKHLVGGSHGAFRCHYAGECSNVCPKGVDPARAIQLMKRNLVFDYLKLRKKPCPSAPMKKPTEAKRLEGVPDAPEFTIK